MPPGRKATLPPELLLRTFNLLDPSDATDRRTLAKVARSSHALYDLAMPVLHRKVEFDDRGLLDFLACGHLLSRQDPERELYVATGDNEYPKQEEIAARWAHLPPPSKRWRRSLALVRSLTLLAPIWPKSLVLLWAVCLPGEPLFPNVSELRILDAPRSPDQPRIRAGQATTRVFADRNVLLFDRPDFCGQGVFAAPLLVSLRAKGHRHITFHTYPIATEWKTQRWTSCRIFDYGAASRLRARRTVCPCPSHDSHEPLDLEIVARSLNQSIEKIAENGPVDLCNALRDYEDDEKLDEQGNAIRRRRHHEAMEQWRTVAELAKQHRGGNLRIFFGDVNDLNPPDCHPCIICGE